jgi:hypothetical protein
MMWERAGEAEAAGAGAGAGVAGAKVGAGEAGTDIRSDWESNVKLVVRSEPWRGKKKLGSRIVFIYALERRFSIRFCKNGVKGISASVRGVWPSAD